MENKFKLAALTYYDKGFSVIPLRPKNKMPIITKWQTYCTTRATRGEIEAWWTETPDANIGIACGPANGRFLFVVDQDVLKDENKTPILNNDGSFKQRGDIQGCPPTASQTSGSGGKQMFYFAPEGYQVQTYTGIRPLVDIRGIGGQVVVPPSIHPNGKEYTWEIEEIDPVNIVEFPKNDLDKFLGDKEKTKTPISIVLAGLPIGEGLRHKGIAQVAGYYLRTARTSSEIAMARLATYTWDKEMNKSPEPEADRKKEIDNVFDGLCKKEFDRREKENSAESEDDQSYYQELLDAVPKDTPKESITSALRPLLEALAMGKGQAEADIYIRNKVKVALGIKGEDLKSVIKYFKEIKSRVLEKMEVTKKKAERLDEKKALTDAEKKIAEDILKSPTLLYDILKMVKKLGVVGEEKNILLHYIILTSRNLKNPLSATVKGDSSSGKSYTLLTTIKMFPKSAYIDLTDATPQSFYYCPDDHFKHKIIVIFEKHGGERADYAIRTLQSEGKLKIQVTVKNPETGQFEAQTIEKDGPTGFVTTTTASFIHAENDTRNISLFPDQSSEQTSRVYESVDSRYLGVQPVSDDELKPWHHMQLVLEQLPVSIPYVKSFRAFFPKNIIRTRRDYSHFLAIIETSAFLHQKQRERIEINGKSYICATLADAYIAQVVVEESLSKSIYELPEKTVEVIEATRKLTDQLRTDEPDNDSPTFTITGLAKKIGWDRDTVAKWMEPANKKGYITLVEESKGSKGAKYKVEDKELPSDAFLPSIEQLAAANPEEKTDEIYNPLTGEVKIVLISSNVMRTDAPIALEGGKSTHTDELDEFADTCISEASKAIGASV